MRLYLCCICVYVYVYVYAWMCGKEFPLTPSSRLPNAGLTLSRTILTGKIVDTHEAAGLAMITST